jgi:biotin carboxylase
LKYGAAHTEFIKNSEDGEIYFLETSSRVGGASAEMVEAASTSTLERMGRNRRRVGERKKYSLPK